MSLNGLDAPELHQIFESACSEPGSWVLLKYASRDEVELLAKGTNGATEMREKITEEPDDSPLYGFIRHRRRSIIVHYVPEATSRVLKARSQVHLQLIGERFSPHDVIVSVTAAGDLTDSALTSACSTHSATASISSSTSSLRSRRLTDIAEEVEKFDIQKFTVVEVSKKESAILGPTVVVTTHDPVIGFNDRPFSSSSLGQGDGHTQEATYQRPSSLGLSTGTLNQRRGSSSSDNTRPPITDLIGSQYTPKVKLAPRLSVDTLKRPHSANSSNSGSGGSQEDLRPVASVPKYVHVRKAKDRANSVTSDTASGPAVPSPSVESSAGFAGEEFSEPAPEVLGTLGPPAPSGPPALTPEKLRLMRALQLRKNTMKQEGDNSPEVNSDTNVAIGGGLLKTDGTEEVDAKHSEQEGGAVVLEVRQEEADENAAEQEVENAKVRGSDNENDSDACSVMSVEIAVAQPRPVSTQFPRGSVTTLSVPAHPTSQRSSMPTKSKNVKSSDAPIMLTKHNQKEPPPTSDDPVVETARSVSAPFLSNTRRDRGSVAVPRTVTVSSGSVFQRIKQLEMLNRNAPAEAAPLRSPSVQVRTVTPPSIITVKKKTTKTNCPTPIPLERTPSSPSAVHQQPIQVMPPIPPKSDFRPGGKSAEYRSIPLQVTTKIPRQNDKAVQTDEITAAQLLARAATSPPDVDVTLQILPEIPPEVQSEASTPMASNRKSLDTTSISKGQKSSESVKEKTTFLEKTTNLLHKLSIEVDTLPPLPMSPPASPRSTSPVDSSPPGGRPKSLFGRDKEKSAEKKQKKAEKEKEKERSRERGREKEDNGSPKTEKKSLLRRISSLTRIVREPTPVPTVIQTPVKAAPKTNLLAGWVNVQLPDTMLWRRKCIKVDSTGWLFLGSTDDENGPGTRKYHLPSDVCLVRIPDPDEQELPFSVQLDLYEGGTLQCACQNSLEQKEVLTGEIERP
ncbi:hypothetical protein L211DRAFT_844760 [Terfezia boudieri ATCC MYA-4762]|uniref:ADF-H domain-containing protein n=1 Tax=Terfezia boudieri ATCC MYA-4762 TaxID=1051890 RepID=A0A3N4M3V4_9PEZI|nr:hypothetical protein L211DRAFT_844760 [Terfezia boudieri ATCC MYA-4762]